MSWTHLGQKMSAILARQWIELKPRHTAKEFARALGVSVRSGRRYAETPELFPESRAVALLRALEQEEAALEARRAARKLARERVKREIRTALALDDPGPDLSPDGNYGRRASDIVGEGREVLPDEGGPSRVGRGGTP